MTIPSEALLFPMDYDYDYPQEEYSTTAYSIAIFLVVVTVLFICGSIIYGVIRCYEKVRNSRKRDFDSDSDDEDSEVEPFENEEGILLRRMGVSRNKNPVEVSEIVERF